jgi:hypothetical protein
MSYEYPRYLRYLFPDVQEQERVPLCFSLAKHVQSPDMDTPDPCKIGCSIVKSLLEPLWQVMLQKYRQERMGCAGYFRHPHATVNFLGYLSMPSLFAVEPGYCQINC